MIKNTETSNIMVSFDNGAIIDMQAHDSITAYDENVLDEKGHYDKALKLFTEISGIAESYLDELDAEVARIAARAKKLRRRVKYGAIVTAAASVSAAVVFVMLKPEKNPLSMAFNAVRAVKKAA